MSLAAAKLNQDYAYPDYAPRREQVSSPKPLVRKKAAVGPRVMMISAIGLIFLTGLLLIMTQAMITSRSDKIIQTKAEILDLKNSNERLKLKIAELKSLERIDGIARTQLGMISPPSGSIEYMAFQSAASPDRDVAAAGGTASADDGDDRVSMLEFLSSLVSGCLPGLHPALDSKV